MSAEGDRIEQEATLALRRWANLNGRLRLDMGSGPTVVIDQPSGQAFMLEVRAMPMGESDGG